MTESGFGSKRKVVSLTTKTGRQTRSDPMRVGVDVGSILPSRLTTTSVRRLKVGKLAAENLIKRVNKEPVAVVEDVGFELLKGETA